MERRTLLGQLLAAGLSLFTATDRTSPRLRQVFGYVCEVSGSHDWTRFFRQGPKHAIYEQKTHKLVNVDAYEAAHILQDNLNDYEPARKLTVKITPVYEEAP